MPFTLSHPAIVVPLFKYNKYLTPAGLVAGSMIPDAGFVLYLREMPHAEHRFHDLMLYYLPLSFVLYTLYKLLIRNMLLSNLPDCYACKFELNNEPATKAHHLRSILSVLISVLIGMFSHVCWDGFTHADGFFVRHIPLLSRNLLDSGLRIYFLLQLIFSIGGLLAIHRYIISLPDLSDAVPDKNPARKRFWLVNVFLFVGIMAGRLIGWPQFNTSWGIIIAATGAAFYSLIIASILIYYFQNEISYESNINKVQEYQG
ncbi:MAG: DUF4184 family protein [Saprospiraceae bacterium]